MSDDFSNIKEGDKVVFFTDYGRGAVVREVIKVTPTTFSTAHYTFYKKNGRVKGGGGYAGPGQAYLPTPELLARAEAYALSRWVRDFQFASLPVDTLRQIREIAVAAKPQESK